MWILVTKMPRPDAASWPGRRAWAALDAVGWPLMWMVAVWHLPAHGQLLGTSVVALSVVMGLARLHRALWCNPRYFFTTWRWGRVLGLLLALGWALKAAVWLLH